MISPGTGLEHPAHWKPLARAALLLATALACTASGLLLYAEECSTARQGADNRRAGLQAGIRAALDIAAAIPALRRQEGELAMRLATAEEQLWPDAREAVPLLQAKLARRAEECGLAMEAFRPRAANTNGAPAGADISLSGDYAQLLRFVELVTASPMAVLIDTMEITRIERDGRHTLLMNATATLPVPPAPKEEKT